MEKDKKNNPIIIPYREWASQLSIARLSGGCIINGVEFVIDKQTNDMVNISYSHVYEVLGYQRLSLLIREGKSLSEIRKIANRVKNNNGVIEGTLF